MFTKYVLKSIVSDKRKLKHYRKLAEARVSGRLNCRFDKRTEKKHYYYRPDGETKEKYIKLKPNTTIWRLQQKRLAREMVRILENNIKLKETMCRLLEDDDLESVVRKIPRAYRPNTDFQPEKVSKVVHQSENPYRREELKELTSFGLYVRTKGELIIAEFLYAMGIDFFYEKALTLEVQRWEQCGDQKIPVWIERTVYPDFTFELPDGGKAFWEHKGMLSKPEYVERDIQKEIDYNMNGIYQPHNLMVTAEGPENDMDMEAISRIVEGWLMPLLNM